MNARDYLTLLRENGRIIAACILACLALAGAATSLMPRSYTASAMFYVVTDSTNNGTQASASDLYSGAQLAKDRVLSYTELIVSPRVTAEAGAAVGVDSAVVASKLSTSTVQDTVVFSLTATDQSAAGAVRIVSAVSDSFIRLVNEVETQGATGPIVTAELVQPPIEPTYPSAPSLRLNLAVGLILGSALGFGIAITRRSMDVSVRSTEHLERITESAVLGTVPEEANGNVAPPLPNEVAAGARAEAFRRIRTNLEYTNIDGACRVLVVTSALPEEGKTTAACNIAAALGAVGASVVLVEGDLRRPGIARVLGLENAVGFTTALVGKSNLIDSLQPTGGFDVLASGRTPPRPNELLSSRRAASLIDELRNRYDFVIIDAPPILAVSDAVNLSRHADGAVVVCRWGRTSQHLVSSAVAQLRAVSVPVIGTILSRVPIRAGLSRELYGTYGDQPEEDAHGQAPAVLGSPGHRPYSPDDTVVRAASQQQLADSTREDAPEGPAAPLGPNEQNEQYSINGHAPAPAGTRPSPFPKPPSPDPMPPDSVS